MDFDSDLLGSSVSDFDSEADEDVVEPLLQAIKVDPLLLVDVDLANEVDPQAIDDFVDTLEFYWVFLNNQYIDVSESEETSSDSETCSELEESDGGAELDTDAEESSSESEESDGGAESNGRAEGDTDVD